MEDKEVTCISKSSKYEYKCSADQENYLENKEYKECLRQEELETIKESLKEIREG